MWTFSIIAALFVACIIFALYQWANLPVLDEDGRPAPGPGLQAVEFPEANTIYAKDQPQYKQLPALVFTESEEGEAVTCWQLTMRDRVKVLFTGKLWASQYTFQKPLQPLFFTVYKTDLIRYKRPEPTESE